MRDRLIELLKKYDTDEAVCDLCDRPLEDCAKCSNEILADYLLENGVICPPCKAGDTVWVYNSITGKIYENTVVCIKMRGKGACRNTMSLEYTNAHKETSCRKFKWAQVGKQVFLTKEAAEKALKGGDSE